ncbi:MAG: GNAT family N-acetyltransferase [Ruminococcus sp.]|nr:GNAT family N-acetyltransferase [Ruminococcus sp.]
MIYLREANFDDFDAEWSLVRSIPTSEHGFHNAYCHIRREDFDKALYDMVENAQGIELPEGFVPETTLFIWNDLQIIGEARVRHYLNDALREGSGHIAIWIAPQYRGKGIGTEALRRVMEYAEDIIPEAEFYLMTETDNEASLKMMLKNGGRIAGQNGRFTFVRISKPGLPFIPTARPMEKSEYPILNEFLYEAIFVPEGEAPPPRDIIERPELKVYTEGFGSGKADLCLVTELKGRIVGAVWTRIMNDYGHIDDETPSLAISVLPEQRHRGIGTELMKEMLKLLSEQGFGRVSLSVQKANFAVDLYRKVGFEVLSDKGDEYIMICRLEPQPEGE